MAELDGLTGPAIIGWKEYLALPELGIDRLKAKIDTGARTSTPTSRLVEACRQRGAEVSVLDPLQCLVKLSKRRPEVFHDGERVTGLDGVVPRIGASGAMIDFVVANAPQGDPRDRERG